MLLQLIGSIIMGSIIQQLFPFTIMKRGGGGGKEIRQ